MYCFASFVFVCLFVYYNVCILTYLLTVATVIASVMKLSEEIGNDSAIMPINSPGGSTPQWGAGQDLMCPTVTLLISHVLSCTT